MRQGRAAGALYLPSYFLLLVFAPLLETGGLPPPLALAAFALHAAHGGVRCKTLPEGL